MFGARTPLHSLPALHLQQGALREEFRQRSCRKSLGHKSITMTLDIYSHVLPDEKKAEEINKLAAMF